MEMYFSHFRKPYSTIFPFTKREKIRQNVKIIVQVIKYDLMKTGQLFNKAHNKKTNNRLRFKFLFCLAKNKVKVQTIQKTANKTILKPNLLNTTLTPLVLLSLQISLISWQMN